MSKVILSVRPFLFLVLVRVRFLLILCDFWQFPAEIDFFFYNQPSTTITTGTAALQCIRRPSILSTIPNVLFKKKVTPYVFVPYY